MFLCHWHVVITLYFSIKLVTALVKNKRHIENIGRTRVCTCLMIILITELWNFNCTEKAIAVENYRDEDHTRTLSRTIKAESVPYQALLYVTNVHGKQKICGATLINNRFVLTAAHCIYKSKSVQILLGLHNSTHSEIAIYGRNIIPHADYDPLTHKNDIGLIELSHEVSLNENINTVSLRSATKTPCGSLARIFGFGFHTGIAGILQRKVVMLISNHLCSLYYGNAANNISYIDDFRICAYGKKGPSYGDSGGPLMYKGFQIGIVSIGDEKNIKLAPSVYTNTKKYLKWISEVTNKDI